MTYINTKITISYCDTLWSAKHLTEPN